MTVKIQQVLNKVNALLVFGAFKLCFLKVPFLFPSSSESVVTDVALKGDDAYIAC